MGKPSKRTRRQARPKVTPRARPKGEPPQLKRLKTRVRNLESKLSESVPKREMEALRVSLEGRISELQGELAMSVPKSEADSLSARIGELEGLLAESVPRVQLEEASGKVGELETRNRALEAGNAELESQAGELRSRVQGLELKESSLAKEVEALKEKSAEAEARAKETLGNIEAVTKRARYRKDDKGYVLRNEDWQELRGLVSPLSGEEAEHKFEVSGRCAGCGMTERDFQQALSILEAWPEDSEKKERMAELKRCKNDRLRSAGRELPLPAEQEP